MTDFNFKMMSGLGYSGEGFEKSKRAMALYVELCKRVLENRHGVSLYDVPWSEYRKLLNGITATEFDRLMASETGAATITELYELTDPSKGAIGVYDRLNYLFETVMLIRSVLDSGRRVLQLDYTTRIGNKWNALSEISRGVVLDDETGEILSLPYHKFFNVNERDGSRLSEFDLSDRVYVLEKLDGNMVHAFKDEDGRVYYGTRSKVINSLHTDVAREWMEKNVNGEYLVRLLDAGYTPLFELLFEDGHEYALKVSYEARELRLTAVRSRMSGEYVMPEELAEIASRLGVGVATYEAEKSMFDAWRDRDTVTNVEGYVLVFGSGLFVKVKSRDYLAGSEVRMWEHDLSRDAVTLWKIVLDWMREGEEDDRIANLSTESMREDALVAVEELLDGLREVTRVYRLALAEYDVADRKELAKRFAGEDRYDKMEQAIMFKLFGGNSLKMGDVPQNVLVRYLG